MAKGDVRSSGGRGGGWGGSYSHYDDEGRGESKSVWEDFQARYEMEDFDCAWLFTLSDKYLHSLIANTTWRHRLQDGPNVWNLTPGVYDDGDRGEDWLEKRMRENDSRIARLVKKHCGEDVWYKWYVHMIHAFDRHKDAIHKEQQERERRRKEEYAKGEPERRRQEEAREAERINLRKEETSAIWNEVDLTAGLLRSDVSEVFKYQEVYGQRDGDWLDDPVAAYATGYGFGEEVKERSGVKLQVTVSLDLSNSMWYNGIAEDALTAFRTIYLTLKSLGEQNPGDMFYAAFTFSRDEYDGKAGRVAAKVKVRQRFGYEPDEYDLSAMEGFREAKRYGHGWNERSMAIFDGEDTWLYPLFQQIELWEQEESDPGAVRLDLIITDAVIEHPSDIRESSKIQERRDGSLQTILLNLMPEEEWINSTLPLRCVQYPANRDNLAGLLRNVLADFCAMYL